MTEGTIASDNLVGATLDERFTIVSLISKGGLSVLYKGVDKSSSRQVTVRVLLPGRSDKGQSLSRFQNAIKLMEGVRHANIVSIVSHGVTPDGAPYLVLPFIEGKSVRERVEKEGPIPYEEALPIIKDIGAALAHAHSHGIVHRNLKPSNILLTEVNGHTTAMLTGFGIAKRAPRENGDSLKQTTKVVGSPLYMSPEQFINSKIDARSDIYSFGCVIHQMLSSMPPMEATNLVQLMQLHHHVYRQHFPSHLHVPSFMDDVLDAATMKMPGNRYAAVKEMLEDIDAGKCRIDLASARKQEPAAAEEMAERQQFVKQIAIIGAGSLLLIALIIFVISYFR